MPSLTAQKARNTSSSTGRIEWLALLQGFSMLLVVVGHVSLTNEYQDHEWPVVAAIERVIYSFHMPLFIFISGWLFELTCLERDMAWGDVMRKKLIRLGIPFICFTVATMLIKILLSSVVKRPVDSSELINTFVFLSSNPLAEMWFIIVLIELMTLYPVYRLLLRGAGVIWGIAAALFIYFAVPAEIMTFKVSDFAWMLPYFIAGIACCRYKIVERYCSRWWVVALTFLLFVCFNILFLHQGINDKFTVAVSNASGIMFSVCLCCMLAGFRPTLFSSFSRFTFQIFLLGIFFQMAVRILYTRTGIDHPVWYTLLFIVSVIAGIYIPVLISKVILKRFPRLRHVFGL